MRLNAIDAAKLNHKDNGEARRDLDRAWTRLEEEADALDNLILTRPIATLADALAVTVHLHVRIESAGERWNDSQGEAACAALARVAQVIAGVPCVSLDAVGCRGLGDLFDCVLGGSWVEGRAA